MGFAESGFAGPEANEGRAPSRDGAAAARARETEPAEGRGAARRQAGRPRENS